jgi:hypothetical protein
MRSFMTILSLGLISLFVSTNAAFADSISLPEPASMSLFAAGAAGLVLAWKRKHGK